MKSVPGKLAKSLFACIVGAWLGLAPIVIFTEMRTHAYLLDTPRDYGHWVIDGLLTGGHILLSLFPLFVLIPMIIIGLPLQALLQRFGKVDYLWTVIPAIPLGPLVLVSLFVIYRDVLRGSLDPFALVLTAVGAFLTTSIFWLVRRPDRDGQATAK